MFSEDALFVGFVLPGETVAVLAGASAKLGHVSLAGVPIVVIVAAIVGDTVGYEIGRHAGTRVLRLPVLDERRERLDEARDFLARRGGSAVFLGRWVAFFRAVTPALAGTARTPYPRFLAWNALGCIAWGAAVVLIGYAAGASYARVQKTVGRDAAFIAVGILVVAVVIWRVRKRRMSRSQRQDRGVRRAASGGRRLPPPDHLGALPGAGKTNATVELVVPTFGPERVVCVGALGPSGWLVPSAGRPLTRNSVVAATRSGGRTDRLLAARPEDHYPSGLVAAGCDVVTVQRALGVHSPLWPAAEVRTRAAAGGLMAASLGARADRVWNGG